VLISCPVDAENNKCSGSASALIKIIAMGRLAAETAAVENYKTRRTLAWEFYAMENCMRNN